MRFKIQTTVLLFVLLGTVSACNTFKDEIISKLQTANAPMELINIFHTLDVDAYTDVYIQNMNV